MAIRTVIGQRRQYGNAYGDDIDYETDGAVRSSFELFARLFDDARYPVAT
jgi:hypothetical protein